MAVTNIYATGAATQAFLNQLGGVTLTLGVASTPTLAQVETWLDQLAAEVDSILTGLGYGTVPASGTTDKLLIGRFVAQKAAAMSYRGGFQFDDIPDKVKQWDDEWDQFLTRLIDKKLGLTDQSTTTRVGVIQAQRYIED